MPKTAIGKMREWVRIEAPAEVRSSNGQPAKTWQEIATVPAEVVPAGGVEIWQGRTVQVSATDRVTIRLREDVERSGAKWRCVVLTQGNRILNIESAQRIDADRLLLMCKSEGRAA